MSVRDGLLTLVVEQPSYGYQLRLGFEERTANLWPLNIGQVYSTLARLERDGLVVGGEANDDGHVVYTATDEGRAAVADWFSSPVSRARPPRDEFAIKLAVAVAVAGSDTGVDPQAVVAQQRAATLELLADLERQRAARSTGADTVDPTGGGDVEGVAGRLLIESLIFSAEAEIRWLDHVATTLTSPTPTPTTAGVTADEALTTPTAATPAASSPKKRKAKKGKDKAKKAKGGKTKGGKAKKKGKKAVA